MLSHSKAAAFGLLCYWLCLSGSLSAQFSKRANIWYFGYEAGLDFNVSPPQPLLDGGTITYFCTATIADTSGQLLFYSDGIDVRNRQHQIMPNGKELSKYNEPTQPVLIVPQPGNDYRYYLFQVDGRAGYRGGCGCASYSVIDLREDDGLGDVVERNNELYAPTTEKLTGVHHANGRDIWVVTHAWESDAFYSYLVTDRGISKPVISRTGSTHSAENGSPSGQMKISPDGKRLALVRSGFFDALSFANAQSSLIEVFDFDDATGKVSNPVSLPVDKEVEMYGIEFSPDGNLLYATATGQRIYDGQPRTSKLLQYNLRLKQAAAIQTSRTTFASDKEGEMSFVCMQLGPDGKIYIAPYSFLTIGFVPISVINQPNEAGVACELMPHSVNLQDRQSYGGLPNFIASYFAPPPPVVVMPNVFTPNGDAFNARFVPIEQQRVTSAQLTIANRWGKELYRTGDLERGWDGAGYLAGIYYWELHYQGQNGKSYSQKGTLSLLR